MQKNRNSVSTAPRGVFKSLSRGIVKALSQEGYVTPTPVQTMCIPPLLKGRDVLGTAQTGTGKTAAFALPIIDYLSKNPKARKSCWPRVLILAPTRELADQIKESINTYSAFMAVRTVCVFGGVNQKPQVRELQRGVDVLVATPGRLLDLMGQGFIHLGGIECLVLDEVDRMLDMGFIHDIRKVIAKVPEKRQTMFFSATLDKRMKPLATGLLTDPVEVHIAPEKPAVDLIEQKVLFVSKGDKDSLLGHLLADPSLARTIVFTRMKHTANKVQKKLSKQGIRGTAIHGNKSQSARVKALDGFKKGRFDVLVATDVAARGLDVDSVTHVINYDLPEEPETYVHRIGRTARAGAGGDAISFCSDNDRSYLRGIERLMGKNVPVDREHPWHSESAMRSTAPPEKRGSAPNRRSHRGRKHRVR